MTRKWNDIKWNNPDFNYPEFGVIDQEAGVNRFIRTVGQWVKRTKATGLMVKAVRYGGTYVHKGIAFHFAMWPSLVMNKLLPFVIIFSLMMSFCKTREVATENNSENVIRQDNSLYNQRAAIWDAIIYSNKSDTVYVGKQLSGPPLNATAESLQLSDSLGLLVRNTILASFDQERKNELQGINQWFATSIYLNSQGVLKELEFGLPNKFKNKHPEQSLRELDLQKIENNLKGRQLEIPEGWKEAGYAKINFAIKF